LIPRPHIINKKPHDSLNPAAFFDWVITADINNRRTVVAGVLATPKACEGWSAALCSLPA
jgi:hypothetical protein